MRLISTEIAVNSPETSSKDLCTGFFHETYFLALTELIIFHQQNDEEKDLTGSGIHQAKFPVRKVAKGALSFTW